MARDITQLHPDAQRLALLLVEKCKEQGLIIKITDCLRSKAEQDALYAQGRTTKGSIVTNVKYPNSRHNWGDAFDFCRNDGKGAYYDNDGFFSKVGAVGRSIGLEWGGDWTSFKDKPHFQLKGWGSTCSKLKARYGTPEKYWLTWEVPVANNATTTKNTTKKVSETPMPTIKKGSKGKAVMLMQVILGVTVDGDFGAKTDAAVRNFQKKNGLAVDGVCGKNTWKVALESV